MRPIKWDKILSVKVQIFDEEHQKLFSLYNDLLEKKQVIDTKMLKPLLDSLADYADYHFCNEEKYMQEYSYPDYEVHQRQHEYFSKKVKEFQRILREEKNLELRNVSIFLRDWLIVHIQNSDRKYGDFFNKNGIY
ncbi:bacteriohemerythrin [Candidatus Riflebacteria bacterium]